MVAPMQTCCIIYTGEIDMSDETYAHNRKVEELRNFLQNTLQAAHDDVKEGHYLSAKMRVQMADQALSGLRRLSGETEA